MVAGEGGLLSKGFLTADELPCLLSHQHLVGYLQNMMAREGHSFSHPQCITGDGVPRVTAALCPTLSLLCYEASALGPSFCPFFRDGESDVFTVFRGGLTGSLASSCNDGSLYIATV